MLEDLDFGHRQGELHAARPIWAKVRVRDSAGPQTPCAAATGRAGEKSAPFRRNGRKCGASGGWIRSGGPARIVLRHRDRQWRNFMNRILVGVDGSNESRAAASFAANLATATGAQLILAGIAFASDPLADPEWKVRLRGFEEEDTARTLKMVKGMAAEVARPEQAVETIVETGSPAAALAELAARMNVDLVVVGHRGRGSIKRMLMGSVADRLVQICSKPVTVVR
jgi:nucleotide-binding universal stress UspA family protein